MTLSPKLVAYNLALCLVTFPTGNQKWGIFRRGTNVLVRGMWTDETQARSVFDSLVLYR